MNLTAEQQKKVDDLKLLISQDIKAASVLNDISSYLLYSEYQLIVFMYNKGVWQGPMPLAPQGFTPSSGSIEIGLFLYWFNNPALITSLEISIAAFILDKSLSLPDSQMTSANYSYLCKHELIYDDGSVISTEKWATYDQGWFAAFINLVESVIRNTWYNNGQFPMPHTPKPVVLKGAKPGILNIAMVGDWGTGDGPAAAVIKKIASLNPDYIIHLGDVYYSGTPKKGDPNSQHYYHLNEEVNNFLNAWPPGYNGKSFTLNSNHEMYSGGNGLFYDVLIPSGSPFSAQQQLSCFNLQFGDWTILGLDSAYNGTASDAFMSGNLGAANGPQMQWIQSLKLNPAKTIVLTHHTGIAYDASSKYGLWNQVNAALGNNDPYAWYWGHAHNGIVYANPIQIPYKNPQFKTNTYARCAGHGALPYGVSPRLQNNPNVLWQAHTPLPVPSPLVYNGFVMLTFQTAGNSVIKIIENFFDTATIQPSPTWSRVIYPGQ